MQGNFNARVTVFTSARNPNLNILVLLMVLLVLYVIYYLFAIISMNLRVLIYPQIDQFNGKINIFRIYLYGNNNKGSAK